MGIINGKFIVGNVGPVVYKVVNGKNIVSTKGQKGKMKRTKYAAGTFGITKRLGSKIMYSFQQLIGGLQDNLMYQRMSTKLNSILYLAMYRAISTYKFTDVSFTSLGNFDFNTRSPLRDTLRFVLVNSLKDGILRLGLNDCNDPKNIRYPTLSKSCEIVAKVSLFRLQERLKVPVAECELQRG